MAQTEGYDESKYSIDIPHAEIAQNKKGCTNHGLDYFCRKEDLVVLDIVPYCCSDILPFF